MITAPEKIMLRENLHYLQPMLDSNHRNSLWYGGDVLTVNYKGYDLTLCANGDVICDYQHSKDGPLIQVSDKSNHAIFLEQLKNAIPNDETLKNLLLEAASSSETLPKLTVVDTNWWEVFVSKDGQEITSCVLDSENYDDALTEMIDNAEKILDLHYVYVYHEYQDDQAYGSQLLQVFGDQKTGRKWLRERVEKVFNMPWDEVAKLVQEDDTFEPDYVSIGNSDNCQFFILDTCIVY